MDCFGCDNVYGYALETVTIGGWLNSNAHWTPSPASHVIILAFLYLYVL
jgi:hypothetical protein